MAKAKKAKQKKAWQPPPEDSLTPIQKAVIAAALSFVPFFFFVILPIIARDHYVEQLKIPREIFLSPPEKIHLVKTGDVPPTYRVNVNGVIFRVPQSYTPVRIENKLVEFRPESRRISRTLSIASLKEPRNLKFTATGLVRWCMPTEMLDYMQTVLRATWHPIRLTFKAQLFAMEGINGKIFEARWDAHHRGFIFPTAGNKGYIGRIFKTNGDGYFEFSMVDPVFPVSLREWVNLAMKIKTPISADMIPSKDAKPKVSLDKLIEQLEYSHDTTRILGKSLSEFFRTQDPKWLIPTATIMEQRGFYPEVIDLHKQYLKDFPIDSPYKTKWNEILDKTVQNIIKLEIDPQQGKKTLRVFCKNLTNLQIRQAWIKVKITYFNGAQKTFISELIRSGRLFDQQEKALEIRIPDDISLHDHDRIDFRIMQVDFFS